MVKDSLSYRDVRLLGFVGPTIVFESRTPDGEKVLVAAPFSNVDVVQFDDEQELDLFRQVFRAGWKG